MQNFDGSLNRAFSGESKTIGVSARKIRLRHLPRVRPPLISPDPKSALAIVLLVCGILLSGITVAQAPSGRGTVQLKATLAQLLGEQQASRYQRIIDPQETISWQVYTPENNYDELPGVMVYVSPTASGKIDARWRATMDEQNLIYIAANESGNKVRVDRRMVLAVMAIRALAQQHAIAMDRIIVSGFSGGGRTASMLASQYPDLFGGALYICGVDFWEKRTTPNVERVIQNRFVFLTGSRDFNRDETRNIHRSYLRAGAKHSKLMVIPGMSHQHPDGVALKEALLFLDERKGAPAQ